MQAQLTGVLSLHRTNSRVSVDSITSFAGSINTKKAYKRFCKGLYEIGVTAEMINQREREIHNIFKPPNAPTSTRVDVGTIADQTQLPDVGNYSGADISPMTTDRNILIKRKPNRDKPRLGWVRPPIDFLVGPLMLGAAEAGNTKRLLSTLRYIQNIDFEDDWKETALHKAAYKGHKDLVRLLLMKGASIEAINIDNNTPLHLAARNGHTGALELLLAKSASIEAMTKTDNTPLHIAAWNGHTSTVELLLTKGASVEAMNINNNTPLHLAAWNGHTRTVERLLTKGASIEAIDNNIKTPLHCAAWDGHTNTVEILLMKGASIEAIDRNIETPLHFAAFHGHTSTVKLLLTKGASIEAINKDSDTPLHLATSNGHTSIVELLLTKGASIEAMSEYKSA